MSFRVVSSSSLPPLTDSVNSEENRKYANQLDKAVCWIFKGLHRATGNLMFSETIFQARVFVRLSLNEVLEENSQQNKSYLAKTLIRVVVQVVFKGLLKECPKIVEISQDSEHSFFFHTITGTNYQCLFCKSDFEEQDRVQVFAFEIEKLPRLSKDLDSAENRKYVDQLDKSLLRAIQTVCEKTGERYFHRTIFYVRVFVRLSLYEMLLSEIKEFQDREYLERMLVNIAILAERKGVLNEIPHSVKICKNVNLRDQDQVIIIIKTRNTMSSLYCAPKRGSLPGTYVISEEDVAIF